LAFLEADPSATRRTEDATERLRRGGPHGPARAVAVLPDRVLLDS